MTEDKILLDDAVAINGLRFHPVESNADFQRLAAMRVVTNHHDGVESTDDPVELQHFFEHLEGFDMQRDLILADAADELAGYARMAEYQEQPVAKRVFSMFGLVHPAWRGKGLGRGLIQRIERNAREIMAQKPLNMPAYLETFVRSSRADAMILFQQEGFAHIRTFTRMIRPDLENIPDLALPEGIETRPALPEHYRLIWDAAMEAFQDHWGAHDEGEAVYQGYLTSAVFQPELWQIAWEGDQVVGMVRSYIDHKENERYHTHRGWTEDICVRRPWRGKGIAKALIARSLQILKNQGMDHAALGVDAENLSGALRLYESMGYAVDGAQDFVFRKLLA